MSIFQPKSPYTSTLEINGFNGNFQAIPAGVVNQSQTADSGVHDGGVEKLDLSLNGPGYLEYLVYALQNTNLGWIRIRLEVDGNIAFDNGVATTTSNGVVGNGVAFVGNLWISPNQIIPRNVAFAKRLRVLMTSQFSVNSQYAIYYQSRKQTGPNL